MSIADSMLKSGSAKNVLLIGAETFSRILDWNDRSTCVLFGDGAGAFILSSDDVIDFGILNTLIRSNGEHRELLYVDGGPSRSENVGKLRMIGNQVFKHAVKDIASIMNECADSHGVAISDIDWFVPHQANQRILNGVAKRLCLNDEQVISTVSIHANTSAASVPLAMNFAIKDGRIKRGDLIMLEAFGGGFTWGASLLRY
jgi:3-oxoacyl-[acyl-carrier-protein] synthase-3